MNHERDQENARRVLGEGGYREFVKPWVDELKGCRAALYAAASDLEQAEARLAAVPALVEAYQELVVAVTRHPHSVAADEARVKLREVRIAYEQAQEQR